VAVKSIIDIDVNDEAFKSFLKSLDKYKATLKELPGAWNATGEAINTTHDDIVSVGSAVMANTEMLVKQLSVHEKINRAVSTTDRLMISLRKSTSKVLSDLKDSAWGVLKWSSAFAIGGAATGFYALDAMARGLRQTRQQAGALGLNPGELNAVQTVYGRFSGSSALLGNISQAQMEAGERWRLYNLGISQSDIEGKTSAQLMQPTLEALHKWSSERQGMESGAFAYQARGLGYAELVGGEANLRELGSHSLAEIQKAGKTFPEALERLKLGKDTASKWDDFLDSIGIATAQLKNTFAKGLSDLAIPLGNVVKAFADLAKQIFESQGFKDGIESFAKWLSSEDFRAGFEVFSKWVINVAKALPNGVFATARALLGQDEKEYQELIAKGVQRQKDAEEEEKKNPGFWSRFFSALQSGFVEQQPAGTAGTLSPSPIPNPTNSYAPINLDYSAAKLPGAFSATEKQYGLPAGLLARIHKQEWDPNNPVSDAGAMGPFQFMPKTAKQYGLNYSSIWDLEKSADAAGRYFKDLLKMFGGDINKAAAGYNWGQGNVQKVIAKYGDQWREHLPNETAKYLDDLNSAGISGNAFSAQPGQGIKISIYNATGGQVNTVVSALAA
jgi:soluble lytic murein transglycosylase-like protein